MTFRDSFLRFRRDEDGASAVELAIFLPLFLLLFIGAVEIGRAIQDHHIVVKGVRDAARYLTRVPDPLDATAQQQAINLALRGSLTSTPAFRLSYWDDASEITITPSASNTTAGDYDNSAGTFRGPETIKRITVSANVTYEPVFFPSWIGSMTFAPSHQQRYFGE